MERNSPHTVSVSATDLEQGILRTLLYFDVFRYPLDASELMTNLPVENHSGGAFFEALGRLTAAGKIQCTEGYYYMKPDGDIVRRRLAGNRKAGAYMKKARFFSGIMAYFPFVDAVFISGSLAKGYVDTKGDIDYFIIARPGRLWLARTLLVAFKKVFLLNSRRYFCVNYFIDSDNLCIPDQNIFTATELAYAIPMYNPALCESFFNANRWRHRFYPNKPDPGTAGLSKSKQPLFRRMAERLFAGSHGNRAEAFCRKITVKYWLKKYKGMDSERYALNFRSDSFVSKHHPQGFQFRVLDLYHGKLKEFGLLN